MGPRLLTPLPSPRKQVFRRRLRRSTALAIVVAGVTAVPAQSAVEVGGPEMVRHMNALRAAHGFPANLTEDPATSAGCRAHNHYSARNGELTHEELEGRPGYTAAGAEAARTSGLYQSLSDGGAQWTASGGNPFDLAPLHFAALINLQATRAWGAESEGYGCVGLGGDRRFAANFLATYPSDGSTNWATYETAAEFPKTPAQSVGLPERTGPTLFVMAGGPRISRFSRAAFASGYLKDADGTFVPFRYVDGEGELSGYLPAGVLLIPERDLKADTRYTAYVRMTLRDEANRDVPKQEISRTWSFTTGEAGQNYGRGGGPGSNPTGGGSGPGPTSSACARSRFTSIKRVGRRFTINGRACSATSLRVDVVRRGRSLGTARLAVPAGSVRETYVLAHSARGRYVLTFRLGAATTKRTVTVTR